MFLRQTFPDKEPAVSQPFLDSVAQTLKQANGRESLRRLFKPRFDDVPGTPIKFANLLQNSNQKSIHHQESIAVRLPKIPICLQREIFYMIENQRFDIRLVDEDENDVEMKTIGDENFDSLQNIDSIELLCDFGKEYQFKSKGV